MDDEQKREAHRKAVRRFRERLKQDPAKFAAATARSRETQKAAYWANHELFLERQRAYTDRNRGHVRGRGV